LHFTMLNTGRYLYPYQEDCVRWLAPRQDALLALDMGTGKSAVSLVSLPPGAATLAIVPAVVVTNWQREANMWRPDFKTAIVKKRTEWRMPGPGEILISTYGMIPEDPTTTIPPGMVLISDEASALKGATARHKSFKALHKLNHAIGGATWLLTGTPLQNHPPELWNVLSCAGLEREAFTSWPRFCHLFGGAKTKFIPVKGRRGGRRVVEWSGKPRPEVNACLQKVWLRRTKEEVLPDLPAKRRTDVFLGSLDQATAKACDEALAALRAAGVNLTGDDSDDLLDKIKDPDLSYVVSAAMSVKATLRPGQVIMLESTTYPGTTREVLLPAFEETGLKVGVDFGLCFSPERVDPGNPTWQTRNTPKVIGGITKRCNEAALALYSKVFDTMVPVESPEAAELVKVYENTFRMINIALANELAQACEKLGLDVWGVIEAAATKPFGFMKFTPGPGLGGHCIPLDPHYLSWKMRTLHFKTRMIELASEINAEMPGYVVQKAADALNDRMKAMKGSKVLVIGVAYKKNIGDLRESPALDIIRLLQEKGAIVSYHDPHVAHIVDDGHTPIQGLPLHSVPLTAAALKGADLALIVTDHTEIDYAMVLKEAPLVFDSRGVLRAGGHGKLVGLSGVVKA
ncbi:MAG TPA: nucleotide sugar dehydrogenase, partial [Gemmatimonadales bacterium]|nr:nucleotide sugar dehydrogenase [Gemmatimonadales bacterium]